MAAFNENSRVKVPAILHLCKLGYEFLPLSGASWDTKTNIFPDLFFKSLAKLNPNEDPKSFQRVLEDIQSELDNEDLGKAFYERLTARSGLKLVDFEDFSRNSLHVVTELPCINDDEEFRPDITLLVNGLPLAFIEVKKPNNPDGILAERKRINWRFQQRKFRRFVNISQMLMYSNNMEYDPNDIEPLQGGFYSTTAAREAQFNFFREENAQIGDCLKELDEGIENAVLVATNMPTLKGAVELETNKEANTPTNRLLTSLFCPARFAFLLQYGIAYVKSDSGLEKHIVRYPQLFAIQAIEARLAKNERKGVVWHTQGSGKTALSYFSIQYLTDYFSRKMVVPKFYFIVDRIDLLEQAKSELSSRGLKVQALDSKDGFAKEFIKQQAVHNQHGEREVTVVNIQKFSDDTSVLPNTAYAIDTQRVYFLDEAHRSYNPKGSFLAHLLQHSGVSNFHLWEVESVGSEYPF